MKDSGKRQAVRYVIKVDGVIVGYEYTEKAARREMWRYLDGCGFDIFFKPACQIDMEVIED